MREERSVLSISIKNNTSSQNQFLFYDSTVKLLLYSGCHVKYEKEKELCNF